MRLLENLLLNHYCNSSLFINLNDKKGHSFRTHSDLNIFTTLSLNTCFNTSSADATAVVRGCYCYLILLSIYPFVNFIMSSSKSGCESSVENCSYTKLSSDATEFIYDFEYPKWSTGDEENACSYSYTQWSTSGADGESLILKPVSII